MINKEKASNIINPGDYLSPEEKKELLRKNDWKGWLEIGSTWAWITFSFTLVGLFPNILTIIIALFILGGRQLACAIIMHDAGHFAIFDGKTTNDFVGKWLGGYPIMHDLLKYRSYHLRHHLSLGTTEDPDVSLTWGYPASLNSMLRKFARDFSGVTGVKSQAVLFLTYLGYFKYNLSRKVERLYPKDRTWATFFKMMFQNLKGPALANFVLFSILWAFGHPELYLLWIGALLTTFNFCLRIRSIAEHSMVSDVANPFQNTRTTYANWLEKMLFAPHHVNFHLEHHLMMGAPSYNLPKMHEMLKQKGFYENALLERGYWNIIKQTIKAN